MLVIVSLILISIPPNNSLINPILLNIESDNTSNTYPVNPKSSVSKLSTRINT